MAELSTWATWAPWKHVVYVSNETVDAEVAFGADAHIIGVFTTGAGDSIIFRFNAKAFKTVLSSANTLTTFTRPIPAFMTQDAFGSSEPAVQPAAISMVITAVTRVIVIYISKPT